MKEEVYIKTIQWNEIVTHQQLVTYRVKEVENPHKDKFGYECRIDNASFLLTYGRTPEEAIANAEYEFKLWLEERRCNSLPLQVAQFTDKFYKVEAK